VAEAVWRAANDQTGQLRFPSGCRRGHAPNRRELPPSGLAPAARRWLGPGRVRRVGAQAPRPHLPHHGGRPKAPRPGDRGFRASDGRDRRRDASGKGGRGSVRPCAGAGSSELSATRAVGSARMGGVITREIRSYVSRDWAAARASKDAFWATRIARLGPIEGLRIADELRRQVVRQNPGWPNDEERHDDLAAHTRLSELLRRASRPRSR